MLTLDDLLFAERKYGAFALRRGFALGPGQRVAVVEDVFTTGGSTREVCATVDAAGASVVAVGSLVDRGLRPGAFRLPARSLPVPSGPAEECPLCADGEPLESPGSRRG